ncbi:MAG: methyltransferase domain-containing protein [Planctomycetes bacterium]|nr:methyltransferase domain-containing protein [Planctomycetota bacterium]
MDISPNWWKTLFDEVYLVTDARSVCDEELTLREIGLLETYLKPGRNDRILDLCGGEGRHSLEMARRGYEKLIVLDYSDFLVRRGKDKAVEMGHNVHFLRSDARQPGLKAGKFRYVILMANSFGYCLSDEENERMLHEVWRLLEAGGEMLLDLCDPDYVSKNFRPFSRHEASEDVVVIRERELDRNRIMTRESVLSKARGLIREGTYCETIYTEGRINKLLAKAGFEEVQVRRNFSSHQHAGDYGFMTDRMIVIGSKGKHVTG